MASDRSVMAVIRAARPQFGNNHDKVAFAVHATFVASGYLLHAAGYGAFRDDFSCISTLGEVGIDGWNLLTDKYAFVYSNPEKSWGKVQVKGSAVNDLLFVEVIKECGSEPKSLILDTKEYTLIGGTMYASHYKNFGKLIGKVNTEILDKLYGNPAAHFSTQISSYETRVSDETQDEDSPRTRFRESFCNYPYSGSSMGFDYPDGHIVSQYSGFVAPPVQASGGSDLFPGPGAGMYPSSEDFLSGGGSGGMLIGPNDPMFFGGRSPEADMPGSPQGVVPAGFDLYGPPGLDFDRRPPSPGGGGMHWEEHFGIGPDYSRSLF